MQKKMLIVILALLLTGCVKKINKNDYEKYLIDTYGDIKFQYVSNDSCNWFNVGSCTYYFTTPELNGKTFSIDGRFGGKGREEMVFEDDYIKTKYDSKLKQYYNKYFNSILKNGIEFKSINLDYKYTYNIPNMTFEDYFKYIEDKNVKIILNLNIKLDENNKLFNIKINDKSVEYEELEKAKQELNKFIYNNYDVNNLKLKVKNIISSNNLNNIKEVSIFFDGCKEDVYYASCSTEIELYN